MEQRDIKSLTLSELQREFAGLGLQKFRALQVYRWLHQKQVLSFEEMSNLSKDTRELLKQHYRITRLDIQRKLVSKLDGTVKFLYRLSDGECVESVLMQYKHGYSLCISTQVGCRMGCKFCASTLLGLKRNLEPSEMLEEIYTAQRETGQKVSSLVLMGIGEPLDNYDNVLKFLGILSSADGMNLSLRHVSLSTCGLVDGIRRLQTENLGLTLSISLHAPNDAIRSQTMPVNAKWNVEALLDACRDYFAATGRRISFEYALIAGVNDTDACARELVRRLKGMICHVNLIPVNAVAERGFRRSSPQRIQSFQRILQSGGVNATVRRELGSDINAACGQLRRDSILHEGEAAPSKSPAPAARTGKGAGANDSSRKHRRGPGAHGKPGLL